MSVGLSQRGRTLNENERLVRQLQQGTFLRIVVPSETSQGGSLALDDWARTALMIVLPHSDGATETRGVGHWLREARTLVSEPVAVLDVYLIRALTVAACLTIVGQLIAMAEQMEQEALAVAVEHYLFLLRPPGAVNRPPNTPSRQRFLCRTASKTHLPNGLIHSRRAQTTERR